MTTAVAPTHGRLYERLPLYKKAFRELQELIRFRELIRYLIQSKLRSNTAGRLFGFFWWLLDPVLLATVYVVFVHIVLKRGGPDFPIYVFSGVVVWKFFAVGSTGAMGQTVAKEKVMKQVRFPRTAIPISWVLSEAFHVLFGVAIVILVAWFPYDRVPSWLDLLAIPILFILLVLTLGLAFFLSALNIFFRDLQNLAVYIFRMIFFTTPVLFSLDKVPGETLRKILSLNPLAVILHAYRNVVLYGRLPDNWVQLGWVTLGSFVTLFAGYFFFVKLERSFTKVI